MCFTNKNEQIKIFQIFKKYKDELCNFVNNQNYSLDAQSQIVSHDQLCEVAIIRDDIEEENLTETGNVTVTVSPF